MGKKCFQVGDCVQFARKGRIIGEAVITAIDYESRSFELDRELDTELGDFISVKSEMGAVQ